MSTILLAASASAALAAPNHEALLAQQGCFHVAFQYADTATLHPDYASPSNKRTEAVEWITVEDESDERVVLQHVLVSGPAMIKHWRQIWEWEGTHTYAYAGDETFVREKVPSDQVQGAWVQEVTNVDDAPRYACSAPWTQEGGRARWACSVDAPLPRREKKNRRNYDILHRTNIHQIEADGWSHIQRNTKVRLEDGKRVPVATEYGHNVYTRIDPTACEAAVDWWPRQRTAWRSIQEAWSHQLDQDAVHVDEARGLVPLWVKLFVVARKAAKQGWEPEQTRRKADAILSRHVQSVSKTPPTRDAAGSLKP